MESRRLQWSQVDRNSLLIFCMTCFRRPSTTSCQFYLVVCGHVFCEDHIGIPNTRSLDQKNLPNNHTCPRCSTVDLQIYSLSELLPPEITIYFNDHNTLIDRTSVALKYQLGTLLFLVNHYQDQESEISGLHKEIEIQNGVLSKIKPTLEKIVFWKSECEKLQNENNSLRRQLNYQPMQGPAVSSNQAEIDSSAAAPNTAESFFPISPVMMGPPISSHVSRMQDTQYEDAPLRSQPSSPFFRRFEYDSGTRNTANEYMHPTGAKLPLASDALITPVSYSSHTRTATSASGAGGARNYRHDQASPLRAYTPLSSRSRSPIRRPSSMLETSRTSVASPFFKAARQKSSRLSSSKSNYRVARHSDGPQSDSVRRASTAFIETIPHVGERTQPFKLSEPLTQHGMASRLSATNSEQVRARQRQVSATKRKSFNR